MKLFRRKKLSQECTEDCRVFENTKMNSIIINKQTNMGVTTKVAKLVKVVAKKAKPRKAVKRNTNPVKEASKKRALELKKKSK